MELPLDSIIVGERTRKDLGDVQGLAVSIADLGLLHPVVVTPEGKLVAGERRLAACKLLGWSRVPVRIVDNLDDAQRLLRAERDENTERKNLSPSEMVAQGKRLEAVEKPRAEEVRLGNLTQNELPEVESYHLGKTRDKVGAAVGVSGKTYQKAAAVVQAAEEDPDTFAPLVERMDRTGKVDGAYKEVIREQKRRERLSAIAQVEALSQDARARVEVADCLEWLPLHPGEFDCLIADPPYNTGRMDWDSFDGNAEFLHFTREWIGMAFGALRPAAHAFIFCPSEYSADVEIILRDLGHRPKSRIVWHHRNLSQGRVVTDRLARTYEIVFHCGDSALHFADEWDDRRFDVQTFAVPQTNFGDEKLHQAQKPFELIRWLVELGTVPGARVLDPFCGAGTTAVVCRDLGRLCVTLEKDPEFAAIARGRLAGV